MSLFKLFFYLTFDIFKEQGTIFVKIMSPFLDLNIFLDFCHIPRNTTPESLNKLYDFCGCAEKNHGNICTHSLWTPLSIAIKCCSGMQYVSGIIIVKTLIDLGADINLGSGDEVSHDKNGFHGLRAEACYPIEFAAECGNIGICSLLLKNGAKPRNSFLYAVSEGEYGCASFLSSHFNMEHALRLYLNYFDEPWSLGKSMLDKDIQFLVASGSGTDQIRQGTPSFYDYNFKSHLQIAFDFKEIAPIWLEKKRKEMLVKYREEECFLESDFAFCGYNPLIDLVTEYIGFPHLGDALDALRLEHKIK